MRHIEIHYLVDLSDDGQKTIKIRTSDQTDWSTYSRDDGEIFLQIAEELNLTVISIDEDEDWKEV